MAVPRFKQLASLVISAAWAGSSGQAKDPKSIPDLVRDLEAPQWDEREAAQEELSRRLAKSERTGNREETKRIMQTLRPGHANGEDPETSAYKKKILAPFLAGGVRWKLDNVEHLGLQHFHGSIRVIPEGILVGTSSCIRLFDADTGKEIWTAAADGGAGNRWYSETFLTTTPHGIYSSGWTHRPDRSCGGTGWLQLRDPRTGALVWESDVPDTPSTCQVADILPDHVVVLAYRSSLGLRDNSFVTRLQCLARSTGNLLWSRSFLWKGYPQPPVAMIQAIPEGILVTDYTGELVADGKGESGKPRSELLSPEDGRTLWKISLPHETRHILSRSPAPPQSPSKTSEGLLYYGGNGQQDEWLAMYRPGGKEPIWERRAGSLPGDIITLHINPDGGKSGKAGRPSVLAGGNSLKSGLKTGWAGLFDLHDGTAAWEIPPGSLPGLISSFSFSDEGIIFGGCGPRLTTWWAGLYDVKNGKPVWETILESNPADADTRIQICPEGILVHISQPAPRTRAYRKSDGSLLWETKPGDIPDYWDTWMTRCSSTAVAYGGWRMREPGWVMALDPSSGDRLFHKTYPGLAILTPLPSGDFLSRSFEGIERIRSRDADK